MIELEEPIEDTNIPEEFKEIGQSINRFVEINYQTALAATSNMEITPNDLTLYKGKILDIIRNNPPLASIPEYYRDSREDFLWYSDFYDEITKEVYQQYRKFVKPAQKITPANYAEELAKIELPYFKELVDLISLERLCLDYEENEPKSIDAKIEEELPNKEQQIVEPIKTQSNNSSKSKVKKRSYEPNLTDEQYKLLAECIESIIIFRRKLDITQLKNLLSGKLTKPLQIHRQKSLVYLFDQLKENQYIINTWISVADGNNDFISFRTEGNKQRYGDETHYIPTQQFSNSRRNSKREGVHGLIEIDEMIEEMEKHKRK